MEKFGRRHFEIFVLVFPEKKPGYRGLICGFLCLRFYLFRVIFQCWDTENMFVIVALSEWNPPYSSKIDIFIQESFNKLIYGIHNTKTCLFKYIENFTSKNWNFSDKIFRYFSYFCSKHRLWLLVRTASMFLSRNKKNNVYPCKPQFYYIKVGFEIQNYIGVFSWWYDNKMWHLTAYEFQLVSRFWTGSKMKWFFYRVSDWMLALLIQSYD